VTGEIYLSSDKGLKLGKSVSGSLPNRYNINFLAVDGTSIYVGTIGGGLWKRSLSELTGVSKEPTELPKQFALSQNYPNPFNPPLQ